MTHREKYHKYITTVSVFQTVGYSAVVWLGYFLQPGCMTLREAIIAMFVCWIAGCAAAQICWNDVPKTNPWR